MQLLRREILLLAVGVTALSTVSRIAQAPAYPVRPVRLIVAFAAGGGNDIVARLIGQRLSQRLGQPFIIENRPGAGGNIGTEAAIKALPDGHTLLLAFSSNAINASLYDTLNFNFMRDITPVGSIMRVPSVMAVHPSVPSTTVPEFIKFAKANPGTVSFASGGSATPSHLAGEMFKMLTGTNMVHVPYRGGAPALTDLLGGQVQVMFAAMPLSIEYIRAGKLRALAVTTETPSESMPDLRPVGEFVPGFEASSWFGISAPKATPTDVVDKLNTEINEGLADPTFKARIADLGGTVLAGSPADFAKLIADETDKWAKVIRAANIKAQ